MPRKKLSIGSVFNSWTILEFTGRQSKHDGSYWLCKCLCGTINEVTERSLIRGKSKCCGCQTKRPHKLPVEIALFNELKRKYQKNAEPRELEINLTDEDFKNLFFNNCHYCGQTPSNKITHPWSKEFIFYSGIDRIDNFKGYYKDNCVSCCKICNVMKNNLTLDVFMSHIQAIAKKYSGG